MLLDKLFRAYKIAAHKDGRLKYVLRKGGSLSSLELLLGIRNYTKNIKTIIDVGANQGQFSIASALLYPEANIFAFEPIPDVVKIFKSNTRKFSRISVFQTALGSEESKAKFNVNDYSHASSVLEIHENQRKLIPETSHTQKIEIDINKLDNFNKEIKFESEVLLKVDVQGYEKEVIKGAKNMLKNIDYILLETSFLPMYEGELLFDDMNTYLKSLGYQLAAPLGFFQAPNHQILQMDVLYIRQK